MSASEEPGPTWRIASAERGDPLEAEALEPLRRFADGCAFRLGRLDEAAGEVLRAGLLAADSFGPTVAKLREISVHPATVPVALGKAGVPMALAWTRAMHSAGEAGGNGGRDASKTREPRDAKGPAGLLVVPHGTEVPEALAAWETIHAEHPRPGDGSYRAGERILGLAAAGGPLCLLVSGGGSSLAESPIVPRADHEALLRTLLSMGLPIATLNAARGLLSRIKVGGLARAAEDAGGSLTVLYASDVPGDEAAVVASGPGCRVDLRLSRKKVEALPDEKLAARILEAAREKEEPERSPPHHCVVSRKAPALAAARKADELGLEAVVPPPIDGPVRDEAPRIAAAVMDLAEGSILVPWGEPLLELPREPGEGGRTSHLLAMVALALADDRECVAALAGTDGADGNVPIGGAYGRLGKGAHSERLRQALDAFDTARFWKSLPDEEGGLFPSALTAANCADLGVVRVP